MTNQKFNKEQFAKVLSTIESNIPFDIDFMYEVYDISFSAISDLVENNVLAPAAFINSFNIINYIIGEYTYALESRNKDEQENFLKNENTMIMMASVVSDKYTTMDFFPSKEKSLSNKYVPPISSLDTYLNFTLNMLNRGEKNNPKNTLITDLLHKTISIARCVLELLVNGFETEAMALWRTLHECECILKILSQNDESVINAYLKHMNYTIAYRNGAGSKEDTDKIFLQIKAEMALHDLKSKDIKKFIEYGWLYYTNEIKNVSSFKLNFRDGLEKLAGLEMYAKVYEQTSEIVHSTPMLIYSSRVYYYLTALINTYESFFRIEQVFKKMFDIKANEMQKNQYENMRRVYYSQLIAIHKNETSRFKQLISMNTKKDS